MARTQARQVALFQSETYDDTITPGSGMESNSASAEGDLNSLRTIARLISGETNWFDALSGDDLSTVSTNLNALEAQNFLCGVQVLTDVTVDANAVAVGVLTFAANAANTETVTTGTKVYTFQTVLTDVDGNVLIGGSASASLDNLIAAITLGAGAGSTYAASTTANTFMTAAAGAGDTMDATALDGGTFANTFATTETLGNGSWGAATLTGGAGDVVVLNAAGSETPSVTAGVSGGVGTVVAILAGDVGAADLAEEAGADALSPKNIVKIRDAATKDAILSGTFEVFGLIQAESGVTQGTAFDDANAQVQITFVTNDGSDDLRVCPGEDIGGSTIEYMYPQRSRLDTLPEDCAWPPATFSDQNASVQVTLSNAYANQAGDVAVDTTVNFDLAADVDIIWNDAAAAPLFRITEDSSGSDTRVEVLADVDIFGSAALTNFFSNGVTINSEGTVDIEVGVTDGAIRFGAAGTGNIESLADLALSSVTTIDIEAGSLLSLADVNKSGSGFGTALVLSDSSAEWDAAETAFGEVSILSMLVQANDGGLTRSRTVAVVQNGPHAADLNISGVGGGAELDAQLGDHSAATFLTEVDIYLDGALQRNGADNNANNDVYPGDTPADGDLKFEFGLTDGQIIIQVVWAITT